MDTGKLILFGGLAVAAYYVYETFFAGPPASWTAAGGTAAQWTALTSAQQAQWNTQTAAATSAPAATAATTATPAAASTATPATGAVPAPQYPVLMPKPEIFAPGSVPPLSSPAASSGMTMDSLYAAIQAASANDPNLVNGMMTGDHWNYWANQITGNTLPVGWATGETPITLATYWGQQSPTIQSALGLSGLGIFGGLGQLVRAVKFDWN